MRNIWIGEALYFGCKTWQPIPGEQWYETKKAALSNAIKAVIEDSNDVWPKVRATRYNNSMKE